ncbi:preprotein translocase subunit Tim44 [Blastopirellula marina]|uniref:Preprotein translocase subunit Tim44 n=1 Tax=Blastopirellula marina TaxID=124 RepID=A0A2S8FFW8_9BACT|nr:MULTISPECIES: thiamine pyrophosphate-binding protein [Pirellulaceae]PQO31065.1 preprotein translocase subunit Tim44 [Blastopirellula marina]RCS51459.1 alpha-keto acid decarboxylase family protein [Bremerella cremea]
MNRSAPSPSVPVSQTVSGVSIGQYLIRRLQEYGLEDIFGIPGDYILSFYGMLEKSPINVVGCTREDCAGFAADAYARVKGLGAVCVTYCVGGLSICNSIAGAYAEKSPVVILTGSPGLRERTNNPLLHHMVRDFNTQKDVFEKLCIAGAELSDPVSAFREIDRVLDAVVRFKRPGYIELPRDMVNVIPHISHVFPSQENTSDPQALSEAVGEAAQLIQNAEKPVILAGVELHRFHLQDELVALAEHTQIPVAATVLGKSVIRETHPLYVGLYEGAIGREEVTRFVEESDLVLLLGTFMTDINMGVFTANLDPSKCIYATSEQLRLKHHHYHGITLPDFVRHLAKRDIPCVKRALPEGIRMQMPPVGDITDQPITTRRMMQMINPLLDDETVVIADIGDSLFAATELVTQGRSEFLSPAYYTSMGFAVPATLGAQTANHKARIVAVIGDGAFQMTGMELSTIVRLGYDPVIIVLDNHGYGTERWLHPGDWKYNEIHAWSYSKLPEVLRGGTGYEVSTEKEFHAALHKAWDDRDAMSIIHVHLPDDDASPTLHRLSHRLGANV